MQLGLQGQLGRLATRVLLAHWVPLALRVQREMRETGEQLVQQAPLVPLAIQVIQAQLVLRGLLD